MINILHLNKHIVAEVHCVSVYTPRKPIGNCFLLLLFQFIFFFFTCKFGAFFFVLCFQFNPISVRFQYVFFHLVLHLFTVITIACSFNIWQNVYEIYFFVMFFNSKLVIFDHKAFFPQYSQLSNIPFNIMNAYKK